MQTLFAHASGFHLGVEKWQTPMRRRQDRAKVLGIWPILSPWSLAFCGMTSAMGNAVIVGCIVEP
jgi:hypothetical protein